jgi:hypothetical protein
VRVEAHQRRIRAAIVRLNALLDSAAEDDFYCIAEIVGTENNDHCVTSLRIIEWELDEPKPKKASSEGS